MKLLFSEEAREKLFSGITKIYKAVSSTLGPNGKTVVLESNRHIGGMTVTKDGVTVARAVNLDDKVESLGATMVRQASLNTATKAGDGTTTSIVLAYAIIEKGLELINGNSSLSRSDIMSKIVDLKNSCIDIINKSKINLDEKLMKEIATISTNNTPWLGDLVHKAYTSVGKNGHVTVDNSKTEETYFEGANGIKIDRGMSNRAFINNMKGDQCILEGDVHVLVSTQEISNLSQIEGALSKVIQERKPLIIIAPCSVNFNVTLAANTVKLGLKMLAVEPPNFGWKQDELMKDIALATGATYFSESTGDDLSLISYEDLGLVSRVVSDQESTVMVRVNSSDEAISQRVEELKEAINEASTESEREFIRKRIATLDGGIGVIYAGGNSDIEQKELYDRIEDAVCAVRSSIEDGVVSGAGKALYDAQTHLDFTVEDLTQEEIVAHEIMKYALKQPLLKILENADLNKEDVYPYKNEIGFGYNLKSGKYGNLIDMGVVDPSKVTKSALENAVSVATTVLGTDTVVYESN